MQNLMYFLSSANIVEQLFYFKRILQHKLFVYAADDKMAATFSAFHISNYAEYIRLRKTNAFILQQKWYFKSIFY